MACAKGLVIPSPSPYKKVGGLMKNEIGSLEDLKMCVRVKNRYEGIEKFCVITKKICKASGNIYECEMNKINKKDSHNEYR